MAEGLISGAGKVLVTAGGETGVGEGRAVADEAAVEEVLVIKMERSDF